MKALFKAAPGAGFEFVDRPEPEVGPADVKIRVLRTGICGTDLHIEKWDDWAASTIATPLIPGHEFSGEVVEVGPLVHDVAVGDLVSGEGHVVCGMCRNCRAGRRQMCIRTQGVGLHRDGAFAEYIVIPGQNVWVHHSPVDPELGAIFDPFGNAVHTALAFGVVGEDVLVTGCGPIGLMSIAVARHVGARFVVATDVSPARLELARRMGADDVVDVSKERVREAQERLGMREGSSPRSWAVSAGRQRRRRRNSPALSSPRPPSRSPSCSLGCSLSLTPPRATPKSRTRPSGASKSRWAVRRKTYS